MNRTWPRRLALAVLAAVTIMSLTSYSEPLATATTQPPATSDDKTLGRGVLGGEVSGKSLAEQSAEVEAQLKEQPKGDDLLKMADDGEYLVVTDARSPRLDTEGSASITAIDPMTWDECVANFDDTVAPYWFKNKYNVCRRFILVAETFERDTSTGLLVKVGEITTLLEMIGTARNVERTIDFRFRMTRFAESGRPNPDLQLQVQLPCINADPGRTSTCATPTGSPSSYRMSIREWRSRAGEEFSLTKTGTTAAVPAGDQHASELRGFFAFTLQMTLLTDQGPDVVTWPDEMFRCDVSTYADGSNCIFSNVASVLQFRLSDPALSQSAAFIKDAQEDITRTRPGIPGKRVPGALGEVPLHRLYSTYDTGNTYKATRRKVPKTCRRYYGVNYSQNRTRDCDEYPFASTYENAARVDPSGPYDYAVRAISASHNRSAGATYGAWLAADHILDRDPFWVKIVP